MKCTDLVLMTHKDGEYTAQHTWAGVYAVWFKGEKIGVAMNLADAEAKIAQHRNSLA